MAVLINYVDRGNLVPGPTLTGHLIDATGHFGIALAIASLLAGVGY